MIKHSTLFLRIPSVAVMRKVGEEFGTHFLNQLCDLKDGIERGPLVVAAYGENPSGTSIFLNEATYAFLGDKSDLPELNDNYYF